MVPQGGIATQRVSGGPRRSQERLAEAAKLYYVDGLNQADVAATLSTTRSNVSRILAAARREGVIRFHVAHPLARQPALEDSLRDAFGLAEARVLAADADEDILDRTGELGARWLLDHLRDGQRVAVSWGRTLRAMVAQLEVTRAYDIDVVQLGGDLQLDPRASGHELVRELAARVGGTYSYLHAPAIVDSPETIAQLWANRNIADQLDKATRADIAVVGIGAFGYGFAEQILESAHLTAEERARFAELEPAGDICGRFFDVDEAPIPAVPRLRRRRILRMKARDWR